VLLRRLQFSVVTLSVPHRSPAQTEDLAKLSSAVQINRKLTQNRLTDAAQVVQRYHWMGGCRHGPR